MNSKTEILAHLNRWSQTEGYYENLTDNLFIELSEVTMYEYAKADGSELVDKANAKAKMKAVHSSSALVCNFFEYWRDKDKQPLSKSMGFKPEIKLLSFEQKFSMGMQGKMPNLDLFFLLEDGSPIAIESKFTDGLTPYKLEKDSTLKDCDFCSFSV